MAKPKAAAAGKSLDEFCAQHARSTIVPRKIRAGLAELADSWEYEGEFIKRCKLSTTDIAAFRDQFADHIIEVRVGSNIKRVYCGTKAFARKLQASL